MTEHRKKFINTPPENFYNRGSKIIFFLKTIIKSVLKIFNLNIYRIKHYELVEKKLWIPFYENKDNKLMKLYMEGLKKAEGEWSDNFSKKLRYYSLFQMAEHILKKNLQHDFVECGCWWGHSTWALSKIIQNSNQKINFHIFDSFEGGLSELHNKDKNLVRNLSEKDTEIQKKQFSSDEGFVHNILKEFDFVKIYKGWIPKRFSEIENKKFQFVHIDVDLYQPTYDSIKFFFPRLVDGGVIVCDDYNFCQFPGAKKAFDYYLEDKKVSLFYESPFGGCLLIK